MTEAEAKLAEITEERNRLVRSAVEQLPDVLRDIAVFAVALAMTELGGVRQAMSGIVTRSALRIEYESFNWQRADTDTACR